MEPSAVSMEQARLHPDMELVAAYAREHAAEWADIRWENEPTVRIVVRFVSHLDDHRAALLGLVEHPERLEVASARYTEAQLSTVFDEVRDAGYWRRGLRGSCTEDNRMRFRFVASAAGAAEELHRRYGDLVALTVGVLPYPLDGAPAWSVRDAPVTDGSLPVLLELVLDAATMTAGADGSGRLHVTNIGDAALEVMTGVLVAWVYRPDVDRPVSEYTGPVTQQGINIALAPGQTSTITPVYFGTASPDPAVGYCLPPGAYEVLTAFTYRLTPGRGHDTGEGTIRSPRTPLTLI
jgi:hypothetical protein